MKKLYVICLLLISSTQGFYLKYHEPKTPTHSLSPDFIKLLKNLFNLSIFIETGTFFGNTVKNALSSMETIYSIELSTALYEQAVRRFKDYPQVKIIQGSSDIIFPQLLSEIDVSKRVCFWLDGHYSEGETALGSKNTPLVEELTAIKNSGIKNAIILIDDVRACFNGSTDYPSVRKIKELILNINTDYQFYIYGDIAIAFLLSDNITVSPLLSLMTNLYLQQDASIEEIDSLKKLQKKFDVFPSLDRYLNKISN